MSKTEGEAMFELCQRLWPINRSLSGSGNIESLRLLSELAEGLRIGSFDSGTKAFDWEVPEVWEVQEAYIETPSGAKICDFSSNNLYLMGYSMPVDAYLELPELDERLHSLPDQPNAIPYITSYYERNWGFAIEDAVRKNLEEGTYHVVIRSSFSKGGVPFGEILIPGTVPREILFSTYICHPSMANNELSGPVLAAALARFIRKEPRYYSYRILFLPETIGALAYLAVNLKDLKKNTLAGFVLTCVGDDRMYSYLPSRLGNTVADKLVIETAELLSVELHHYSWLDRGSDERQYCSPGIDLPVCSLMRSKYHTYDEYHTSLDRLGSVVTEKGLQGTFDFYEKLIQTIEQKRFPKVLLPGEPQLGRRGLFPSVSKKNSYGSVQVLLDYLSMSDGTKEIQEINAILALSEDEGSVLLDLLRSHSLIEM